MFCLKLRDSEQPQIKYSNSFLPPDLRISVDWMKIAEQVFHQQDHKIGMYPEREGMRERLLFYKSN